MALKYSVSHNGNTWNSSADLDSIPLSNGSVTSSISSAGTRTLSCAGKYMPNNLVIGAKTLNCAGKIMSGDVTITASLSYPDTPPRPTECLTFTALEATSLTISWTTSATLGNLIFSKNGARWEYWAGSGSSVSLSSGDYIRLHNDCRISCSSATYGAITVEIGRCNLSGYLLSLNNWDTYLNYYAFSWLFNDAGIVDASQLILPTPSSSDGNVFNGLFSECSYLVSGPTVVVPADLYLSGMYQSMFSDCTSLVNISVIINGGRNNNYCFKSMFSGCTSLQDGSQVQFINLIEIDVHACDYMFYGCTSLTVAPTLPATRVATDGYAHMFEGCTSLTVAPELPITTLSVGTCCRRMFKNCKNLVTPPSILPATALVSSCYESMFYGCKALTSAPALPATSLADSCYSSMFDSCKSLTVAPVLPATTLASSCYDSMFSYSGLTTVPVLPATTLAQYCYSWMFYYCNNLQVSDTQTSAAPYAWRIPTSGTFTNTYSQSNMFYRCAGTRSSNNMAGAAGNSYTYYTQNPPRVSNTDEEEIIEIQEEKE